MLTREEILALPAGAELNVLLAIELFGLSWGAQFQGRQSLTGTINGTYETWGYRPSRGNKPVKGGGVHLIGYQKPMLPDFSGDIAAAWLVVEAMQKRGCYSQHTDLTPDSGQQHWVWHFIHYNSNEACNGYGETAPLAICRAALLALLTSPTPSQNS